MIYFQGEFTAYDTGSPVPPRLQDRRRPTRTRAAFTLLELVAITAILGVLAVTTTQRFGDIRSRAAAAAVAADLDTILKAAETYHAIYGKWPANVLREEPTDFDGMLPAGLIAGPTPIDGDYDWEGPGSGTGIIGVTIHEADPTLLAAVDALIDDGDLSAGSVYVVLNMLRIEFSDPD